MTDPFSQHQSILSQLRSQRLKRKLDDDDELVEEVVHHMSRVQIEVEEARRAYARSSRETCLIPASHRSSWSASCRVLAEKLKRDHDKKVQGLQLISKVAHATDPLFGLDTCSGDDRLNRFNQTLDSFRWKRTAAQVLFHDLFTNAVLKKIYGVEWEANAVRVMREHNLKKIHTEVMIMTPRRYGKTVSVAMWVVAALLHMPGVEIGIFSTGQRASSSLMRMATGFLNEIPGAERRVVKSTDKDLFVSLEPLPDGSSQRSLIAQQHCLLPSTSKLHSFPSSVEGE